MCKVLTANGPSKGFSKQVRIKSGFPLPSFAEIFKKTIVILQMSSRHLGYKSAESEQNYNPINISYNFH